jgi:glycosyltransferase involved in cell wall biosynthesis
MRILVVQETDWIGRNPILHHRMLESLAAAGDNVLVLDYDILWARRGRRPLLERRRVVRDVVKFVPGSGIVVVRPAMLRISGLARPTWLASTTVELLRQFRRFRPDVVVAYGLSNAAVARVLAAREGVPFVFHIFDSLHALAEPTFLAPVARIVERSVLRSADEVIVVHRKMLDYVGRMGVPRSRITFIMNGFTPREPDAARVRETRRRLGILDDQLMILFVGWLYTHSGLREIGQDLLGSDRYDRWRLVVAGDGDLLPGLQELSRRSEHGDRLVLLGRVPVDSIPELIAAADVCLAISDPEAPAMQLIVPAKVDEYLELRRPVIATRLPGMLAELGDVASMIWIDHPEEALRHLDGVVADQADPRAHLQKIGDSGADYGRTRQTWSVVTERFHSVLRKAVGETVER